MIVCGLLQYILFLVIRPRPVIVDVIMSTGHYAIYISFKYSFDIYV